MLDLTIWDPIGVLITETHPSLSQEATEVSRAQPQTERPVLLARQGPSLVIALDLFPNTIPKKWTLMGRMFLQYLEQKKKSSPIIDKKLCHVDPKAEKSESLGKLLNTFYSLCKNTIIHFKPVIISFFLLCSNLLIYSSIVGQHTNYFVIF